MMDTEIHGSWTKSSAMDLSIFGSRRMCICDDQISRSAARSGVWIHRYISMYLVAPHSVGF